jgi:hypothetical protein
MTASSSDVPTVSDPLMRCLLAIAGGFLFAHGLMLTSALRFHTPVALQER